MQDDLTEIRKLVVSFLFYFFYEKYNGMFYFYKQCFRFPDEAPIWDPVTFLSNYMRYKKVEWQSYWNFIKFLKYYYAIYTYTNVWFLRKEYWTVPEISICNFDICINFAIVTILLKSGHLGIWVYSQPRCKSIQNSTIQAVQNEIYKMENTSKISNNIIFC